MAPAFSKRPGQQIATSDSGLAYALTAGGGPQRVVGDDMEIRRITPVEAERLQGFQDNHTKVPYRGKPADKCPDGPRYKALGNSFCVPVVRWIGERILEYETAASRTDEKEEQDCRTQR